MTKYEVKNINGIVLVNKPQGLTSNAVLQKIKRIYTAKKAGHTGSLDPLATGMLPICFGEATKFSQYLLDADKCYEVTGLLGVKTDTGDAMGKVIATKESIAVSEQQFYETVNKFIGPIQQTPSMYSALKHQGQPLYKYARAGIEINRKPREVTIKSIEVNAFNGKTFKLTVHCSKGTYIRNLVEDIGDVLQVFAHVTALHRIYTAGFEHYPMYELSTLLEKSEAQKLALLLPLEQSVHHFPKIVLSNKEAQVLKEGKILSYQLAQNLNIVQLYEKDEPSNRFIGLGSLDDHRLKVKRLLSLLRNAP